MKNRLCNAEKKDVFLCLIIYMCVMVSACGETSSKENEWIPSEPVPTVVAIMDSEETKKENVIKENEERYDSEELTNALLVGESDFAQMLWKNYKSIAQRELLEVLNNDCPTLYFSENGDDNNNGRTPETPKKTLSAYSGVSNINLLMKCGEKYNVPSGFVVGSNVVIGFYGEGERPIIDCYLDSNMTWIQAQNQENIWVLDLKDSSFDNHSQTQTSCNIGHLLIDGEVNWKRLCVFDDEEYDYIGYLAEQQDGSWAVDWTKAELYLYSEIDPNLFTISMASNSNAFSVSNSSNSAIIGLEITGAGRHGISISESNEINVSYCYIHDIGGAILNYRWTRFGNAVEIWDNAKNVNISNNHAEWIYDTCYTNQGSTLGIYEENITFSENIGRYSFWGIENWGDGFSTEGFSNIIYCDNLIMDAVDVTAPKEKIQVDMQGRNIHSSGERDWEQGYISYRAGGHKYHQMSLLSTSANVYSDSLIIEGNTFANSNRFLYISQLSSGAVQSDKMNDNVFCIFKVADDVSSFRIITPEGGKIFTNSVPEGNNNRLYEFGAKQEDMVDYFELINKAITKIIE